MQAACTQMDARYREALQLSIESRNSFDSAWMDDRGYWGMYAQYVYSTPFFVQIRFGKWDDILKASAIPASKTYANAMWHFARGLAQARKHNIAEATIELSNIKDSTQSTQLQESPPAFNPGVVAVNLSEKILQGIIAEEKNDYATAIAILREAVNMEDAMLYNEPRDWVLPVRQYLGNTLIKVKQYAEAEKVYKEDLRINPNNAWSLTGLQNVLMLQNKTSEVTKIKTELSKALIKSDVKPGASVF